MSSERDSVLHSWCVQTQWQAPTIVGGRGAHFWDADGHDYLDMSSLAECSNLGHQHPAVIRAIQQQAERLCFVTSAVGRTTARGTRSGLARKRPASSKAGSSLPWRG
jgi:4-aminobutyrate aminotransferase and related aminotransferases